MIEASGAASKARGTVWHIGGDERAACCGKTAPFNRCVNTAEAYSNNR